MHDDDEVVAANALHRKEVIESEAVIERSRNIVIPFGVSRNRESRNIVIPFGVSRNPLATHRDMKSFMACAARPDHHEMTP